MEMEQNLPKDPPVTPGPDQGLAYMATKEFDLTMYRRGHKASWSMSTLERCWDAEELAVLAEHYPGHGPRWDGWPDLLPRRSAGAIHNMASVLGLKLKCRWTDSELGILRRHYPEHGGTWAKWRELLPDRTADQIYNKASHLGLKTRHRPHGEWTPEEDSALIDSRSHGSRWDGWAGVLPGRTPDAIATRARKLGVSMGRGSTRWSDKDKKAAKALLSKAALHLGRSEVSVARMMLAIAERPQTGEESE